MGRKFSILVAFCVVLFGAILAGYWDMLDSEKLRQVRDQASASIGGSADAGNAAVPNAGGAAATGGANGAVSAPGAGADPASRTASAAPSSEPSATSSPTATPPAVNSPSFDVLRIEPDGSAVLAGRAMPNARIRLMDGATAIASAKASPDGDFAVVLDERLTPGDHQIRIEADKGDGVKTISEQTAIVSVPKRGQGGELLAMVETPNQPSRIINLPDPTAAANAGAATKADAVPATAPVSPASETKAANAEPSATVASRDAAQPIAAPATDAARKPAAAPSPFAVEAVEIENGTIYVAGRAPGTAPVRVYIDNTFVGEDRARANERFLVTAKVPLTTGNHEIRADMIGGDGAVASRVEVPFAKPAGEAMSAIASNDMPAGDSQGSATQASGTPSRQASAAAGTGAQGSITDTGGAGQTSGTSTPNSSPSAQQAAVVPTQAGDGIANGAPVSSSPGAATDQAATGMPGEVAGAMPSDTAAVGTPNGVEDNGPTAVPADTDIATIRQAPLESVHTRVLIRRGDTLWRISRETYGQGRRYTVIYLANGDQIRNPNRIYPGQLFRLPKEESKAID